jgi:hypothetical protein
MTPADLDPSNPAVRAIARQETLNAWNSAVDGLTAALSYAKTYRPPADTDIYLPVDEFIRRAAELLRLARGWKE